MASYVSRRNTQLQSITPERQMRIKKSVVKMAGKDHKVNKVRDGRPKQNPPP